MASSFDDLIQGEGFKNIEPEKIQAVRELAQKLQGKSLPEAMMVFNNYQDVFKKGKSISPQERELMIAAILDSMDKDSREKFVSAMKMVSMMKG